MPQPTSSKPIIFFGYSQLGYDALDVLIKRGEHIGYVVTHDHNPHENIWFGDCGALAEKHGIPVLRPEKSELESHIDDFKSLNPDLFLFFYYRYMVPQSILDIPNIGAFNMHGSYLPKYRGRAPVNWAILRGETETGITLHNMEIKPDAGYIVDRRKTPISMDDTAGTVTTAINGLGVDILRDNLDALKSNTHNRTHVDITQGNYCGGRNRDDGRITPQMTALETHNLVRALQPYPQYPGAFVDVDGVDVILHKTYPTDIKIGNKTPGTLYNDGPKMYLVCGDCLLEILEK